MRYTEIEKTDMAKGSGKGQVDSGLVAAGGVTALVFTVCFLIFGVPMLISGIALVQLEVSILYDVGIGLIVVSVVCLVIGIALSIYLCVKGSRAPSINQQGQVLTARPQNYPVMQYPAANPYDPRIQNPAANPYYHGMQHQGGYASGYPYPDYSNQHNIALPSWGQPPPYR